MNFRHATRNSKQVLSQERCEKILHEATSGVLCLKGCDEYPYGIPISYAYVDGRIYFHGMPHGHKVDAFKASPTCCFTVIETDQVVPEEYTTYFRSVMVFGRIHFVEDDDAKRSGLSKLVDKYSPDFKEGSFSEIESKLNGVGVFEIEVEFVSGKEAIEFAEMMEHADDYSGGAL